MVADDTVLERARQLVRDGRHDEARRTLAGALEGSEVPRADALALLADIERSLGRPGRELRALENLLPVLRTNDDAALSRIWARIAVLRDRQGDFGAASAAWNSAITAAPDVADYHFGLARTRFSAGDIAAAADSAATLLERFPDQAFTYVFNGHVKKALGDRRAAANSYRRALELDAGRGEALYNLAEMRDEAESESLLAEAENIVARPDAAVADQVNAGFAAARILDRAGRFREAFDYLRIANERARSESARRGIRYDRDAAEAVVARTIEAYPKKSFESAIEELPVDLVPVFVIGPPRSGTTLIEQILSAHSTVETAGEITAAQRVEAEFRHARSGRGRDGPVDPADATDAELIENARERYVDALFERGLGARRIVDKLPANYRIAGFVRTMFPAAPIVHCVRDLRATGFSLYSANFGAHEAWYHDLGDIAHNLRLYGRLMAHWSTVLDPPCVEVSYEALVRDPANGIARLLEDLELAFEPACLSFHESERPILTASHEQVRRPVYTSAVDHWKNYSEWLGPVAELPALSASG